MHLKVKGREQMRVFYVVQLFSNLQQKLSGSLSMKQMKQLFFQLTNDFW